MLILPGELVRNTEETVTEEGMDVDWAKQAEELAMCLKSILGCLQATTSENRVDILGVPINWTKRAMNAIESYGVANHTKTLEGVWRRVDG